MSKVTGSQKAKKVGGQLLFYGGQQCSPVGSLKVSERTTGNSRKEYIGRGKVQKSRDGTCRVRLAKSLEEGGQSQGVGKITFLSTCRFWVSV